jgi:hypothetical protein
MTGTFRLPTGAACRLSRPDLPFLERYHVLVLTAGERAPTPEDVDALLCLARCLGRRLGSHYFGDAESFTILFNGARTRRSPSPHVHIIPARSVSQKRWALAALHLKNVTRLVTRMRRVLAPRLPWRPHAAPRLER